MRTIERAGEQDPVLRPARPTVIPFLIHSPRKSQPGWLWIVPKDYLLICKTSDHLQRRTFCIS